MAKNITPEGITTTSLERVTRSFHERERKSQLTPGDILVVRIGRPGSAAVVPSALCPANCAGLVILKAPFRADTQYLLRYLNSPQGQRHSLGQTRGSTRQTLNTKLVAEMPIPLPPLLEQQRIAAILDKADAVRRKRQRTLDLADQFLRSAFLDMFGDPVTNPKGWPVKELGAVSTFTSGSTPSKSDEALWRGTFPWVSPKDMKHLYLSDAEDHISEEVFAETSAHRIPVGSVLIVVRGMILTHTVPVAVNRVPVAINQDIKAIMPRGGLEPVFVLFALLSQHGRILSKVGTAAHGTRRLETRDIEELPVILPPDDRQRVFVELARTLDGVTSRLRSRADAADSLCGGLAQLAFRGEL